MSPVTADGNLGVGLLGAGVVGGQVARSILAGGLGAESGRPLELRRVLVRDVSAQREGISRDLITGDAEQVLTNERTAVIVEVMGGAEPARSYIAAALSAGKHVVTANKEVLAKHGDELERLASDHGVALSYEASVGGGIPVLAVLRDSLGANRIATIRAIINGTTNYILTSMADSGSSFEEALAEAQRLGYAEADPTADVDAHDAVYKLCILARLAWGVSVRPEDVLREGIGAIEAKDLRYAGDLGFKVKLLAIGSADDAGIRCRVHPALVPADVPIAGVGGVLNAVEFSGDLVGQLWLQGAGAGAGPTASAVLGDVLRIARDVGAGAGGEGRQDVSDGSGTGVGRAVQSMDDLRVRYYVRLSAVDRSGVLSQIAAVFGDAGISIASVIQQDSDTERGLADLVITTHPAPEHRMQAAASELRSLDVVSALDNLIRIEDYG